MERQAPGVVIVNRDRGSFLSIVHRVAVAVFQGQLDGLVALVDAVVVHVDGDHGAVAVRGQSHTAGRGRAAVNGVVLAVTAVRRAAHRVVDGAGIALHTHPIANLHHDSDTAVVLVIAELGNALGCVTHLDQVGDWVRFSIDADLEGISRMIPVRGIDPPLEGRAHVPDAETGCATSVLVIRIYGPDSGVTCGRSLVINVDHKKVRGGRRKLDTIAGRRKIYYAARGKRWRGSRELQGADDRPRVSVGFVPDGDGKTWIVEPEDVIKIIISEPYIDAVHRVAFYVAAGGEFLGPV